LIECSVSSIKKSASAKIRLITSPLKSMGVSPVTIAYTSNIYGNPFDFSFRSNNTGFAFVFSAIYKTVKARVTYSLAII